MFRHYIDLNKDLEELARRIVVIDKRGNGHNNSSTEQEDIELVDEETERRREEWFAKLRAARCRKTDAWGHTTGEDVYDYTTQEEYDYNLKCALAVSPEERYQDRKKMLIFHDSHKYMRGVNADDGYGCGSYPSYVGKCIPTCRYYPETGRIEDSEVIESFEKHEKPKIIPYRVDNKGQIVYHYPVTNERAERNNNGALTSN
jgi:hypothetical protein